nr:MAG: putative serine protease [Wenzhou sobemo-like virus 4]QRW42204.1 MAG: putative serine protease [Wenzhou sobemo-like virus 4]QRW42206.1 MAG: putative serine protease [Wenzhou sobemo-like virus 4]QRW42208.1 MAG: putative serine protease [Wenzhou sobemo-like virus 4]QRW42210.1 MAG: putative serine protease [Wenzhou sobemo-like virus 4]
MTIYANVMEILYSSVIYVQIVAMVILAITALNVVNPLNKTMILVSFGTIVAVLLRSILYWIETMVIMTYGTAKKIWVELIFQRFVNNLGTDPNRELKLLIVMAIIIIFMYIWKVCKYLQSTKVVYVVPSKVKKGDACYVEERAMPNSIYEHIKVLPPFQAMVMASLDGYKYHVMGQCFWVDEGLVTAAHVIEGFEHLCIYRDLEHSINIKATEFECGNGDYAVCREPTKITQKVGLSKAKLSPVAVQKNGGVTVNVSAMDKRTAGFLDEHTQFGFVTYTGSTTKGFSGAPYCFGRTVYGMHLGSDSKNMGYDGAFLKAELKPSRLIKQKLGIKTEDSAEWLIGQVDRYAELDYVRSPGNPDEWRVRVGGRYHLVDDEVMATLLQARKGTEVRIGKLKDFQREALFSRGEISKKSSNHPKLAKEEDPEKAMVKGLLAEFGRTSIVTEEPMVRESGPSVDGLPLAPRDAMSFNDSGNLLRAPTVDVGALGVENVRREFVRNPSSQTCQQMVCTCQTPSVSYHMESRKSMPAQQSEASARTVKNKNRRMLRQQQKKELELYKQLCGPIQHGASTLHPQQTQMHGSTQSLTKH